MAVLLNVAWSGSALAQAASLEVRDANTVVQLVAERDGVVPGEPVRVGLRMTTDPHWHTYWRNPGEAGITTKLAWTLPEGVEAGEIAWPTPIKFGQELGVIGYGYEAPTLLPVQLTVPTDFQGDTLVVRVKADWLACEAVCIPGKATLSLSLPVLRDRAPQPSQHAEDFAEADAAMPRSVSEGFAGVAKENGKFVLTANFAALEQGALPAGLLESADTSFVFLPGQLGVIAGLEEQPVKRDGQAVELTLTPSRYMPRSNNRLEGLLVVSNGEQRLSFAVDVTVDGAATALATPESVEPVGKVGSAGVETESAPMRPGLLGVLGAAVLGGLVLNLMPCVFPVLALKITGFVQQAGQNRSETAAHGFAFASGVLVSFWVIAVAVLALQSAGRELGWGFQLQSPLFVGLMAVVLFAVGLNFAGVFDIGVGVMNTAGRGSDKLTGHTRWGSFGSGVLATALATPCSAPFMTTAVGYALVATPVETVLVLTALGLGMALPYVLLSVFPGWLRFLPRPGAWMETFKQLMAFPMFLVVAYLVWVFDRQAGEGLGLPSLLLALVIAGMGLWAMGRWHRPSVGATARRVATVACVLMLIASTSVVVFAARNGMRGGPAVEAGADGMTWEPYSDEAVERHLAQGRPVFVDFTADWCATCKFNERVFIDTAAVRDAVDQHNVALLKADWTLQDDDIRAVLASYGVASVPLYVFHSPDPEVETIHFDTMFSSRKVLNAIEAVASDEAARLALEHLEGGASGD